MKRFLIVLALLILMAVFPSLYQVYRLYLSTPEIPEIAEEDYVRLGNEAPFRMQPLPEDQVEVTVDPEKGKQVVDVKSDGYKLEIDPELQVVTREIEPGRILIYKGTDCRAVVGKKLETKGKSVQDWFQEEKVIQELTFTRDLITFELKEYDLNKSAYEVISETTTFGYNRYIVFQYGEYLYSVSKAEPENKCLTVDEIFKGIIF